MYGLLFEIKKEFSQREMRDFIKEKVDKVIRNDFKEKENGEVDIEINVGISVF